MSTQVIASKIISAANMMGSSRVRAGRTMQTSGDLMRFTRGLIAATNGLTKAQRNELLKRLGA